MPVVARGENLLVLPKKLLSERIKASVHENRRSLWHVHVDHVSYFSGAEDSATIIIFGKEKKCGLRRSEQKCRLRNEKYWHLSGDLEFAQANSKQYR